MQVMLDEKDALMVQNTFRMKSYIKGHKIHQLGSTANSARIRLNRVKAATLPSWGILWP